MIRTLFIISGAGLLLAIICIGGAFAIGGRDIATRGWSNYGPFWNFVWDGNHWDGNWDRQWGGAQITREVPWSGDDEIVIGHRGEVHYKQGLAAKVEVTGPSDLVNRLQMTNGRLRLDGAQPLDGRARLDVTITAPRVERFSIVGAARLTIDDYDQDQMRVEIRGSGDITAHGKARRVDVEIMGSGDADVGGIDAEEVNVDIKGSGGATIAPTQRARIDVKGSGDVTMLTNPPDVDTDIKGSGDIRHRMRDASSSAAPPPKAPAAPAAKPI